MAGIGIFDSGLGGLTVFNALRAQFPGARMTYLADNARFPYGTKTTAQVKECAQRIIDYFIGQDCSLIVIACHTASAVYRAAPWCDQKLPVVDMLTPAIDFVKNSTDYKKIGLIATPNTVRSRIYQQAFSDSSFVFVTQEAPTLAAAVESQDVDHLQQTISHYLGMPSLEGIDALLLACTHYSLVQDRIAAHYNGSVALIDPVPLVVAAVARQQPSWAQGAASVCVTKWDPHFCAQVTALSGNLDCTVLSI